MKPHSDIITITRIVCLLILCYARHVESAAMGKSSFNYLGTCKQTAQNWG